MWKMYNETEANLTIKLGGENEIDVKELSDFLKGTYDILSKITSKKSKNSYFKMNFKASEKGSIILDFIAITPEILKIGGCAVTAATTLKLFLEIIKLVKDLKGKKAKNIDFAQGTVTNYYGEVNRYSIETLNFYISNPEIEKEIKENIKNVKNRESLEYSVDKKESLRITEKEITEMSEEEKDIEESEEEVENFFENVEVKLYKVPFQGNSQWDLVFENEIIKAHIWDKEFLNKFHSGEIPLSPQDIFVVSMNEIKEKNKAKYYILKILNVKKIEEIKIY